MGRARAHCGWAAPFEIIDAEVASEVCPLFFGQGRPDALASLCGEAGFAQAAQQRRAATPVFANGDDACRAACRVPAESVIVAAVLPG